MRSYVATKSTIAADLRVPETCRHIITPDTYERVKLQLLLDNGR